jgi:hypothetical protein
MHRLCPLIVRMRRCQLALEARAAISSLPRSRTLSAISPFLEACQRALHLQGCASATWSQMEYYRLPTHQSTAGYPQHSIIVFVCAMRTPAALRPALASATSGQHALVAVLVRNHSIMNPTVETSSMHPDIETTGPSRTWSSSAAS